MRYVAFFCFRSSILLTEERSSRGREQTGNIREYRKRDSISNPGNRGVKDGNEEALTTGGITEELGKRRLRLRGLEENGRARL